MVLESLLSGVLNRFLAAYVEDLNTSNLNANVWSGDVKLRNLKLKRGALDKFRLPIDVLQGYIGELTLTIPWSNLKGQPVKVQVEDVFVLAVPSSNPHYDPEEDEERAQQLKREKLENAELLSARPAPGISEEEQQKNESFTASLVNRIVDNLQITVSNVHVRYEDNISVPNHPFSVGFTLSEFSAVSTDENWIPSFIHNSLKGIHKLAKLECLAVYFNSDDDSIQDDNGDLSHFAELIATEEHVPNHQFILKPVSGTGRLIMNKSPSSTVPKTDVELLFKELGFVVNEDQYNNLLSMVDSFHFYSRQNQYKFLKPPPEEFIENRPRALFKFAQKAVLYEVHDRQKRWTWDYLRERRDDRLKYLQLFKHFVTNPDTLPPEDREALDQLERKLDYKDIRFYRSIARSELKKDQRSSELQQQHNNNNGDGSSSANETSNTGADGGSGGGWLSWIWGSSTTETNDESTGDSVALDPQAREELYEAIDWDEDEIVPSIDLPSDAVRLKITGKLDTGSFTLRRGHQSVHVPSSEIGKDIISISFDNFFASWLQRLENFSAAISLAEMRVDDGTVAGSLHPQIVRVLKNNNNNDSNTKAISGPNEDNADDADSNGKDNEKPFFYLEFDHKPVDKHADMAALVQMQPLEIIYHAGYVDEIYKFFKPPASYLESVNALIDVASETLEGIRKDTRAGLEYALEKHRTIDLRVEIDAPIIIIPEDVTVQNSQHVVLDAGHLSVQSQLADQQALAQVRSKQNKSYNEEDYQRLESLMYDKFFVAFNSVQLIMGESYQQCIKALHSDHDRSLHLVEQINIAFKVELSIMPKAPNLTKMKVSGQVPELKVNFSDKKYKTLMRMLHVAIPQFGDDPYNEQEDSSNLGGNTEYTGLHNASASTSVFQQARSRNQGEEEGNIVEVSDSKAGSEKDASDNESSSSDDDDDDDDLNSPIFFDAESQATASNGALSKVKLHQKMFEFTLQVDKLQASIFKSRSYSNKPETLLANTVLEGFKLDVAIRSMDLSVDILLKSLYIEDKLVDESSQFKHLVTSKEEFDTNNASPRDLVRIRYTRCQPDSPEFFEVFEGINQSVDIQLSTINLTLTRGSVLQLQDFIMTTFTSQEDDTSNATTNTQDVKTISSKDEPNNDEQNVQEQEPEYDPDSKMRLKVQLDSIVLILNDDGQRLGTLSLSSADVALSLFGPTMRITGKLGGLEVTDDVETNLAIPDYKKLLSIQGDHVADFVYETFDPKATQSYPGYDTYFYLRTGSLQFIIVERSVHRILTFFSKFAKMKEVYDAATEAAAQPPTSRIKYDILINTPIIIATLEPSNPNRLVANLGEISASNEFDFSGENVIVNINAGLRAIRLSSAFYLEGDDSKLGSVRILHDVNLTFDIVHAEDVDRTKQTELPTTRVTSNLSDVKISLTQEQYCFFMALSQVLPRAFSISEEEIREHERSGRELKARRNSSLYSSQMSPRGDNFDVKSETSDLLPELPKVAHTQSGTSVTLYTDLEVIFTAGSLAIDLYSAGAQSQKVVKEFALARFALTSPSLKFRMLSNNSMEADMQLKTLSFHDTRQNKHTKFKEIIPPSKHSQQQFTASITISGEPERSTLANISIDTPTVVFSLEPMLALVTYFTSPFSGNDTTTSSSASDGNTAQNQHLSIPDSSSAPEPNNALVSANESDSSVSSGFAFRVNINNAKVVLLAEPERSDTEALILSINSLELAQQNTLVVSLQQVGMLLCRMNREKEAIHILDKLDISFSSNNGDPQSSKTEMELNVQKITLRLSYRDILLINVIMNKAIELSSQMGGKQVEQTATQDELISAQNLQIQAATRARKNSVHNDDQTQKSSAVTTRSEDSSSVTKETLRANFAGCQVVLVGDVHELPLIDLQTPKFMAKVINWSSDLRAGVTFAPAINYFNLKNSHWEPLMDPWEFTVKASKALSPESFSLNLSSRRRAELNVTAAFLEIALAQMSVWSRQEQVFQAKRGESAPFRIYNRTGHSVQISSDFVHGGKTDDSITIPNGHEHPWRFEDWRTVRDNLSSGFNLLKIELQDTKWAPLRNISVDREGETVHILTPKVDQVSHRLLCDITLKDNIKVITLRSTFTVENSTLLPIELVVVDANGKKASEIWKISPGANCPLPIELVYFNRIKVRPDPGFGYAWSHDSYHWKDLIKRPARAISCKSTSDDPPFRFQAFAIHDKSDQHMTKSYPYITLRLRAPVEVENLLPYDIKFRVFDKNREHNWSSFLRKGGTSPMHVAELSHLLLLSVELQDTSFKRSEFAIINTDNAEDLPVEDNMILLDKDGLELRLHINYVKYPDSGGAFKIQLFCPYTIINKTGLDVNVRSKPWMGTAKSAAGQDMLTNRETKESTPFLFSYPTVDNRNRAMLRIDGSSWSKPLSFEAIGTLTEVTVPSKVRNNENIIGIDVSEGLGQYKLTKVVTIYPRFIVHNTLDEPIRVRTVASIDYDTLKPGEQTPLHLLSIGSRRQLSASFNESSSIWSAPINMQDVGRTHLKLCTKDGAEILARIDIALQKATIFIRFSKETADYPFLIRNECDLPVKISQTDLIEDSEDDRRTRRGYSIEPHTCLPYAWDYPSAIDKMLKLSVNRYEREINTMEIGSLKPFHLYYQGVPMSISIDIRAKGRVQEIALTKFEEESSVYQVQSPGTLTRQNSDQSYQTNYTREVDFVEKETDIAPTFSLELSFEGVGISIMNSRMDELAYASFRGFDVQYSESQISQTLNLSLQWIQIDNQLYGGLYPILLYPTVINRETNEMESHPNLQASIVLLKDQAHGVMHFKYASVLLQEMTVEIDEDFLFAVMDFGKLSEQLMPQDNKNQLTDEPPGIPEPDYEPETGDVYFEVLHLQPLQINISFMRTETLNSDQKIFETNRNPVAFFLNAVTMTLGNVNEAPVRLNALVLENTRSTTSVLLERISYHYSQDFFSQLYRVLGSADFLGNPVGLFNNVSSGVADIFYEPLSGFIVHGNRELGIGIARGAGSFVKKTVFGISDSFAKVTGSIGKGLSAATLDREFQSRRRMKQHRNRPKHALYGVTAGATSFVSSVASGFEGLAMRPIEGAERGGASGFFRGLGKGVVGAVTKPIVGVFDMANNVTEGIRNTTTVFDQTAIDRVRVPRYIARDGILRPYQEREALGQMWLKTTENGKYFNEKYACHVDVSSDGDEIIVILTERRILLLKSVQLKVGWDVPLSDLATINLERRGISLILRGGVNGPFLPLPDQATRLWFFGNIEKVVNAYNQQKTTS